MKKIYSLLLVIFLFSSCSNNHYINNQNRGSKFSHLEQNIKKQTSRRKIAPTESKQKSWNKGIIYGDQFDFDNEDQEISQEISDSFIDDESGYIGKYKVGNQYEINGVEYQPQ